MAFWWIVSVISTILIVVLIKALTRPAPATESIWDNLEIVLVFPTPCCVMGSTGASWYFSYFCGLSKDPSFHLKVKSMELPGVIACGVDEACLACLA